MTPPVSPMHLVPVAAQTALDPAATIAAMRVAMRLPVGSRVAVAMSGGVDSSVVAALLAEAGYDVFGLTARLYDVDPAAELRAGSCCAPEDARDARAVAQHLGIRHYSVDERAAFARDVIEPFADAWTRGDTPNPCVACNRTLKFDRLTALARDLGAEALATGHYARLGLGADGHPELRRGVDPAKDQAYFLYPMGADAAVFARFPLGGMTKTEVRAHAVRLGVPTASKPESMDVCFVGGSTAQQWLHTKRPPVAGQLVDLQGVTIGRHDGLAGFTVGQRHGLNLPRRSDGEPWYVVDKRGDGTVVVGSRADLQVRRLQVARCSWVGAVPQTGDAVHVQVRHRGAAVAATVTSRDGDTLNLDVHGPLEAAARGQSAVVVLPDAVTGDRILGGGEIAAAEHGRG